MGKVGESEFKWVIQTSLSRTDTHYIETWKAKAWWGKIMGQRVIKDSKCTMKIR